MHILAVIVIFFISSCSSTQVYDLHDARYIKLLENIKLEPNLTAIKQLRHVYVSTQRYKKNINAEISNHPEFEAFLHKDLKASLLRAYEVLDKNYTSLNGHYLAMATSFELGEKEQSKYHQSLLNILLEAIWASGDGKSISTAFFSTSSIEVDSFIELHGFDLINHNLIQIDEKSYDQVRIKDLKTGQIFDWYFDISAQRKVTISIKQS